jgi:hypothetical protein
MEKRERLFGSKPAAAPDDDPTVVPAAIDLPDAPSSLPHSRAAAGSDPPADEQITLQTWAEKRRILPRFLRSASGEQTNPDYWKLAAVKAFKKWDEQQPGTEAEFDAALSEALGQSFR